MKATLKQKRKRTLEGSISGNLVRELIADITNTASGHKLQNGELRKNPIEPEWICPRHYKMEKIKLPKFQMEYLSPKEIKNNRVILQLHGGGYIGPMKNIYRSFAVLYSKALGNGSVLTIDYRVAPEYPFPSALEDAYTAYQWLLERYPANQILLAGDSAGGGLAFGLCHYLRDKKMPFPKGIIAMSPWTDLTCSGQSYRTNYEKDPLFGRTNDNMLFQSDYAGEEDPQNPYISPVFGEFTGFPPILLQVGSYEMLLSDSLSIAKKAKEANVLVRCSIYKGMFHVFQMARGLLPESREAWKEIKEYLDYMQKKK